MNIVVCSLREWLHIVFKQYSLLHKFIKEIMISTYTGFLYNKMENRAICKRTLESESDGKFIHNQIHSVMQGVEHFYAKISKLNCWNVRKISSLIWILILHLLFQIFCHNSILFSLWSMFSGSDWGKWAYSVRFTIENLNGIIQLWFKIKQLKQICFI